MYDFTDDPHELPSEEEQELNSGKKLNDRQEQFCHEYMIDFNGCKAAMRCGYMPFGAAHTAYRLLKTEAIKKRLRELKKEHREQTHISFSFIIERLLRIADDAMEGDPVLVYDPTIKTWKDTGRRKPDRPTALKALSLLGRHIGMFDKEYAETIEKKEEYTQEDEEKQTQLVDAYLDASINFRESKEENQRLKAALEDAGIPIPEKPEQPKQPEKPVYPKDDYRYQPPKETGPKRPRNPSEYDDLPHYEYKHIMPYKNHPEHKLVTEEKMAEAIRKKVARLSSTPSPESVPIPPKAP